MDIAYTEYFSLLNIFHSWQGVFFGFEDIQSVRIKGYDWHHLYQQAALHSCNHLFIGDSSDNFPGKRYRYLRCYKHINTYVFSFLKQII